MVHELNLNKAVADFKKKAARNQNTMASTFTALPTW